MMNHRPISQAKQGSHCIQVLAPVHLCAVSLTKTSVQILAAITEATSGQQKAMVWSPATEGSLAPDGYPGLRLF